MMAIAHQHFAYCDKDGCELNHCIGTEMFTSVGKLREAMRADGWKRRRHVSGAMMDLCPDCANDTEHPPTNEGEQDGA